MRKNIRVPALWGVATLCFLTPAAAGILTTTLNLTTPVTNVAGATRVVYHWATPLTGGAVSTADVSDLTMELYDGAVLVYSDTVISGGVLQPFGGVARSASDFLWDFNLTTGTLNQMRNFSDANTAGAFGAQFLVEDNVALPVDGDVVIRRVVGGVVEGAAFDKLASQSTVPEPATSALIGLGLVAAAWLKRRG